MWHVYILICNDNSFYAGIATDLKERLARHNNGKASKYTRGRRPVKLVYWEECSTKSEALKREIELKRLSKKNKNRLIKFGPGKRFPSAHRFVY